MEDIATLAALSALALKVTSLLKYLTASHFREAVTTLIPWGAAFVVLLLGAEADATAAIVIPGLSQTLGTLDVASLLLVATAIGSTGSVAFDFRKAIDGTDSAREPALMGAAPSEGV